MTMPDPTPRPDVSPVASAALTRAFDAGQVEFRLEEEPRIVFPTDTGFQAWYLAEAAEIERQVREQVAAELREDADAHRRVVARKPSEYDEARLARARTLDDAAARITRWEAR